MLKGVPFVLRPSLVNRISFVNQQFGPILGFRQKLKWVLKQKILENFILVGSLRICKISDSRFCNFQG